MRKDNLQYLIPIKSTVMSLDSTKAVSTGENPCMQGEDVQTQKLADLNSGPEPLCNIISL